MNFRTIVLLGACLLVSCEGDKGDVCQIDDDCGSGLECCKSTAALEDRGTCQSECVPSMGGDEDAATDAASSSDSAVDATESDAN